MFTYDPYTGIKTHVLESASDEEFIYGYDVIPDKNHRLGRKIRFWQKENPNMSQHRGRQPRWQSRMAYHHNQSDPVTIGLKREVAKIKKAMAAMVEYKTLKTDLQILPSATTLVSQISATIAGDGDDERDGNKITSFSIQIKGNIQKDTSATISTARFLVFMDRHNVGTPPVRADMFADDAAFFNGENKLDRSAVSSRFKVLWDKTFQLDANHSVEGFEFYKRISAEVLYTGTTASDESKNQFWIMTGSNEITNEPIVNGSVVFKWIG